ncbi:hypothetical protein GCM10010517_14850 [Streptosporangium fragile]|uniref:Ricin B lectin domain-containing protein n=2 Tax=Streptosporangium fragile TaxID=46186 RepID=A0ABN3VT71_9ACTN
MDFPTPAYVSLLNAHKGIDIEGASTENGARAILWDFTLGANQRFTFKPGNAVHGEAIYCMIAEHSGKALKAVHDPEPRVVQGDFDPMDINIAFHIRQPPQASRGYWIVSVPTSMVLAVDSTTAGSPLVLTGPNPTSTNQLWLFGAKPI